MAVHGQAPGVAAEYRHHAGVHRADAAVRAQWRLPGLQPGEIATLISTVAIAAEIILISSFGGRVDVRRVTVVQLAVTSLLAFAMVWPTGEALPGFSWLLLASAWAWGLPAR